MLLGRAAECARIERLLADARAGTSGALVIGGDPGVGKTALLEHAAASATGIVIRTTRKRFRIGGLLLSCLTASP